MGKSKIVAIGGIVFFVVVLSFLAGRYSTAQTSKQSGTDTTFPLLAKRIFVDNPSDSFVNFVELRKQLNTYFTDNQLEGSVYFEYLPTGTSIRIDGDKQEVGASLLKVPAAMELYKASELNKIDLDQTVTIQEDWLDSAFGDLYKKGGGYQLTLREAAKIMLEDSDNTALNAVSYHTNGLLTDSETPVSALDIDISIGDHYTIAIGARDYSSVLKCLYFSCYLNKEHSQEILNYLSNTKFDDRLRAGVADKSLPIAHKTGNFSQETQSDCGIVYIPNRNYVLCVMIKGTDSTSTAAKIAALSKLAYEFVIQQK